jgi:DUF1365 family protein
VSFYYCFEADGERLAALVAEVANTPWNERHLYVVGADGERTPKAFHVSPFMDMEMIYRWSWMPPSDALRLRIESRTPDGDRLFDASLALQRVEITGASLARVLTRHPWMTLQVLIGIYWQAWRLRRRGAPFFPHPGRAPAAGAELVS